MVRGYRPRASASESTFNIMKKIFGLGQRLGLKPEIFFPIKTHPRPRVQCWNLIVFGFQLWRPWMGFLLVSASRPSVRKIETLPKNSQALEGPWTKQRKNRLKAP